MSKLRILSCLAVLMVGSSAFAELCISEICPRPNAKDPNGLESGWIELYNDGDEAVDLADYEIVRVNRGKALKAAGKPLASRSVSAKSYTLVYTSEEYDNVDSGVPQIYANDVMVYPNKISPKKFPLVALYKGKDLLQQLIIPVDLPDNQSIAPCGGAFPNYGNAPSEVVPVEYVSPDPVAIDLTGKVSIDSGSGVTETDGVYDFSAVTVQKAGVKVDSSVTALLAATNCWSVAVSFKGTDVSSGTTSVAGMPIVFCRTSANDPKSGVLAFINLDHQIVFELRDASSSTTKAYVQSDREWLDGNWHRLEIVYGGGKNDRFAVSVDGDKYIETSTGIDATIRSDIAFCIGHALDSTYWTIFNGQIKDIEFSTGSIIPYESSPVVAPTSCKTDIKNESTVRSVILPNLTKGTANNRSGEVPYGPNVGPLFGVKHSFTDLSATAPAVVGQPYAVTLAANPVTTNINDIINGVTLYYRSMTGGSFSSVKSVAMTKGEVVDGQGQLWNGVIPAEDLPAASNLVQWAAVITDRAGNNWRSPSFRSTADGYEWYGTIVAPATGLAATKLPLWHLFVPSGRNIDSDNDARICFYDTQTSNYYDNIVINLRGNTTANFTKKSHCLKFNKCKPLVCTNPFDGEEIECRKTSILAEFADPSRLRATLSSVVRRLGGQDVPFCYPVSVLKNGKYYQLAFHSNRYTDELLEDYYGYDPYGYALKNVGTLGGDNYSGGESVTLPDDSSLASQATAARKTFQDAIKDAAYNTPGKSLTSAQAANVTKAVVKYYDLPAWVNFLALARICQECDDGAANLCLYYDRLGTGTWRPMAYDLHQSWGAYYASDNYTNPARKGCWSNDDDYGKCHPLFGGMHVATHIWLNTPGRGNRGFEAVYQNEKFRRMHLRRLRTLMDNIFMAPGTSREDTPFWRDYAAPMIEAMREDDLLDRQVNKPQTGLTIYVWDKAMTFADGVDDLWNNYVVPRRVHFFQTHSVTNTAKAIGYANDKNAGIPLAQSATADLKAGFSVEAVDGGVVIRNANAETVDMSGWKLSGPLSMTFDAGTVIDQQIGDKPGELFVVADRLAYVTANEASLTDEVIVGNAKAGSGETYGLKDSAGETVIEGHDPEPSFYTGDYDEPVVILTPGEYECSNANFKAGLVLGEGFYEIKNNKSGENTASNIVCAGTLVFKGKGIMTVEGKKESLTLIDTGDLIVSNGVLNVTSKAVSNETVAVNVKGNFAVEDKGTFNLKLTKNAAGGRGVFMASKDKFCRIGDGGTFNAELNGVGNRAIQGDKGSVDLEILDGATVSVTGTGENVRAFKMKGKIKVKGGDVTAGLTGAGSEIFSADKTVQISGGTLELSTTDDCVSATDGVKISGGRFYGVSSGNDVIDSNQDIEISGGLVLAYTTAVEEDGVGSFGLDVSSTNSIFITGGTVCALGGVNSHCGTLEGDQNAFVVTGANASDWSSRYIAFSCKQDLVTTTTTVGLPAIDCATCSLLYSVPNLAAGSEPAVSDVAPVEGSLDFHEVYETAVERKVPTVEASETTAVPGVDFTNATVDVVLDLSDATTATVLKGVLELRDESGAVVSTATNDFAQSESWAASFAFPGLSADRRYTMAMKVYEVFGDEWTELASETGTLATEAATGWVISYDGETSVGGSWSDISETVRQFTATDPSTPDSVVTVDVDFSGEYVPDALADLDDWLDYQAGLTPFMDGESSVWKALTRDGWITLSGAPFVVDATNRVRVVMDYRTANPTVCYQLLNGADYVALTNAAGVSVFASRLEGKALSAIVHQTDAQIVEFYGEAADAALAEVDGVRYRSLADAFAAAKASGTELKLLWDATLPERTGALKGGNAILIDLNGRQLVNGTGWKIVEVAPGHVKLVGSRPIVFFIR